MRRAIGGGRMRRAMGEDRSVRRRSGGPEVRRSGGPEVRRSGGPEVRRRKMV